MDLILQSQDKLQEVGHILADTVVTFPTVFLICHITLTLHSIKKEWVVSNAINNPLANYLISLCCCNAGGILTSILTNNKTILECIFFGKADPETMLIFTVIWWLTFYCPFNAFSKSLHGADVKNQRNTIIMIVLIVGKELLRCKKIYTGVALGKDLYGKNGTVNYLPFCIILGTLASNGTGFLVNLGKFITARPYSGLVLLGTSSLAKFSVIFATLYTLYPEAKYIIVLGQFIVTVNYKLGLAPVADGLEKSFKICGGYMTQPFGSQNEEAVKKVPVKSKDDKKKKQ